MLRITLQLPRWEQKERFLYVLNICYLSLDNSSSRKIYNEKIKVRKWHAKLCTNLSSRYKGYHPPNPLIFTGIPPAKFWKMKKTCSTSFYRIIADIFQTSPWPDHHMWENSYIANKILNSSIGAELIWKKGHIVTVL